MQKHYLISSSNKQSNVVPPQHIPTPEPNKKVYKDYDSVRKLVLDDKPNNLIKKTIK